MLLGLGALLLLGGGRQRVTEDSGEEAVVVTSSGVPAVIVPEKPIVTKTTKAAINGSGAETIVKTSNEVIKIEKKTKRAFDAAGNAKAKPTEIAKSRGDIEAAQIAAGTFEYGGAVRPTENAVPVWNNRYGWYWVNPVSGRPVAPKGVEWSTFDTSVNMGSEGTNIGLTLPPGWVDTGGGSARLVTAAPNTINQTLKVSPVGATIVVDEVNGYGTVYGGAEDE